MTNFEQGQIYRHPAFEGLRDEEVVSVYNIASLKKINTGDILVKEGGTDTPAYLILEGSAKVQRSLKGRAIQIGVVRQGDWVPQALFFEKGRIF